ncbi:unnamed protein product [Ascophyllum nodosum]
MSSPEGRAPEVVASHFCRQFYGEVVMNEPAKIMRFYSDESTFLFESGTTEEAKPVRGRTAIKAKLDEVGILDAEAIDLGGEDAIDARRIEEGQWP